MDIPHVHIYYWKPSINEDGWLCTACDFRPGEPQGFSPDQDRDNIQSKVESVLIELTEAKLLHVSNNTAADILVSTVVGYCEKEQRYDQYSICEYLFNACREHGDFWKRIAKGVLSGKDIRERCDCGKLATIFVTCGKEKRQYCQECRNGTGPLAESSNP